MLILSDILSAIGFLTVIPVGQKKLSSERMAAVTALFPLAGLLIGGILVGFDFLVTGLLPRQVTDALIVTFLAVITGGLHLDGIADTADGLIGGRGDRERTLAIMKDSHTGAMGVIAIALLLLVKFMALDSIPSVLRPGALLLAPALSRWGQVLVSYGSRPARSENSLAGSFITYIKPTHFIIASMLAAGFGVVFGRVEGLVSVAAVAIACLLLKIFFNYSIGGMTGDTIGASSEITEALVFVIFSATV
ncbi:MAG: adenosylcobinamide-GDP ribazoletransferase [Nitrospirota bacterium]